MIPSPFSILGVSPDASISDLKRAYRRLVRTWHPDRFHGDPVRQGEAKERLSVINAAYRDCLTIIADRRRTRPAPSTPTVVHPPAAPSTTPPHATATLPAALPAWPHLLAIFLLLLAWLVAGRRYPFQFLPRVGFTLLFTILPAAASLWYALGVLKRSVALPIYTGLTLLSLISLLFVTLSDHREGGIASMGPPLGEATPVRFPPPILPSAPILTLSPPSAGEGPVTPVVPPPAPPATPRAPTPPAAPVAPPPNR